MDAGKRPFRSMARVLIPLLLALSVIAPAMDNRVSAAASLHYLYGSGSATGGKTVNFRVELTEPAPSGGAVVTLNSNNAAIPLPATVTVSAGQTERSFGVASVPVTADTNVTVSATYLGVTKSRVVLIKEPLLSSISVQSKMRAGGAGKVTVRLNGRAYAGGVTVNVVSSNPAVIASPGNQIILAGNASIVLIVNPSFQIQDVPVTFTATYDGNTVIGNTIVRYYPTDDDLTATAIAGVTQTADANASTTAVANQTATEAANQTATADANASATEAANQTATANANASATEAANQTSTAAANETATAASNEATQTSIANDITQTAIAADNAATQTQVAAEAQATQTAMSVEATNTAIANETSTAIANETSTAIANETSTAAANETATQAANETATEAANQTATTAANETATQAANETATQVASETTATAAANETATQAANETATQVASETTATAAANETATQVASETTATAAANETATQVAAETTATALAAETTATAAANETATQIAAETTSTAIAAEATAAAAATATAAAGAVPCTPNGNGWCLDRTDNGNNFISDGEFLVYDVCRGNASGSETVYLRSSNTGNGRVVGAGNGQDTTLVFAVGVHCLSASMTSDFGGDGSGNARLQVYSASGGGGTQLVQGPDIFFVD